MSRMLGSPFSNFRNKIRRVLSDDPGMPFGGHVVAICSIPGGLEVAVSAPLGDPGPRVRNWRVMIEEVEE